MSAAKAEAVGWATFVLVWATVLLITCLWSNNVWQHQIIAYNKEWPVHQGTIISRGNQVVTPYDTRSGFTVRFPNYYNQIETASVYGYPRPLGAHVPVRVSAKGGAVISGAIYPFMKDGSSLDNPLNRHHSFFPTGADIVIGGIGGLFIAMLIGIFVSEMLEGVNFKTYKHRLGTN